MSKKNNPVPGLSWGYAYVTSEGIQDTINGRLYGLIEALGLPEKQETSLKGLIRETVWDCFRGAIYISPERHTEIRKVFDEKQRAANIGSNGSYPVPMQAI